MDFNQFTSFARRHYLPCIWWITLSTALGFASSRCYLLFHNTLNINGNWTSSKTTLEKAVTGAYSFVFEQQTLAKSRLNLGAWHGFQEVVYRNHVDPRNVEFDFMLEPGAYCSFIFNKRESGYSGIRLSANAQFGNIHFSALADGQFIRKQIINQPILKSGSWHHVQVDFGGDDIYVLLDGRRIFHLREPILAEQTIGFRGSLKSAYIDNIIIQTKDSAKISESFNRTKKTSLTTFTHIIIALGFNALLALAIMVFTRMKKRHTGFTITAINLLLIVAVCILFWYQYVHAQYYPPVDEDLKSEEDYWREASASRILREIRTKHSDRPKEQVYRVLFVGTSQTWGAGASEQSKIFAERLAQKLHESAPAGVIFQIINASIPGVSSSFLLTHLEKEWLKLKPQIVVINLSNNDNVPHVFKSNVEKMAVMSLDAGIKPVLILEPNSPERDRAKLFRMHDQMKQVGAALDVPVLDMQAHFDERHDDGFLWWDFVHLTDFGHEIFAEKLFEVLSTLIKVDPQDPARTHR